VREGLKRIGVDSTIEIVPWRRGLYMVREGKADAIFKALRNDARDAYLYFPDEPLVVEKTVAFKLEDSHAQLGADFSGAKAIKLGVGAGFIYGPPVDAVLKKNPFKKLETAPTVERNIEKLMAGRIDILLADRVPAIYSAMRHGHKHRIEIIQDDKGQEIIFSASKTYLAFSKATISIKMVKRFSEALTAMKKDGTYDRIANKYR